MQGDTTVNHAHEYFWLGETIECACGQKPTNADIAFTAAERAYVSSKIGGSR
jgi:hypothetical protein